MLKGHCEYAEGKEDILGHRHESRGLAMRGAMCFQVAQVRPACVEQGIGIAMGSWGLGCKGNLEDPDG